MSWYRFAPVETIQSTKPASIRGTRQETPYPPGVRAPVSETATVVSGASILRANRRAPSRRRAAL